MPLDHSPLSNFNRTIGITGGQPLTELEASTGDIEFTRQRTLAESWSKPGVMMPLRAAVETVLHTSGTTTLRQAITTVIGAHPDLFLQDPELFRFLRQFG